MTEETREDKKLFEDVNKYLYDTPKRTKVTMSWVSANCKLTKSQATKEILEEANKRIDKIAKKVKAQEVDIGEYDKFISCWELEQQLQKLGEEK